MADTPQAGTTSSIEDQIRLREQKAQMLREKGAHPYGNGVAVSHTTGFVRMRHADDDSKRLEEDQSEPYGVAGRVVAMRSMGKPASSSLRDRTAICRSSSRRDKVGEHAYEPAQADGPGGQSSSRAVAHAHQDRRALHRGGVRVPHQGAPAAAEKWHGLTDHETRYRQRYVIWSSLEVAGNLRRRPCSSPASPLPGRSHFIEVERGTHKAGERVVRWRGRSRRTTTRSSRSQVRIALELHLKR